MSAEVEVRIRSEVFVPFDAIRAVEVSFPRGKRLLQCNDWTSLSETELAREMRRSQWEIVDAPAAQFEKGAAELHARLRSLDRDAVWLVPNVVGAKLPYTELLAPYCDDASRAVIGFGLRDSYQNLYKWLYTGGPQPVTYCRPSEPLQSRRYTVLYRLEEEPARMRGGFGTFVGDRLTIEGEKGAIRFAIAATPLVERGRPTTDERRIGMQADLRHEFRLKTERQILAELQGVLLGAADAEDAGRQVTAEALRMRLSEETGYFLSGVGVTSRGDIVLISDHCGVRELARQLIAAGAQFAILTEEGGSCATVLAQQERDFATGDVRRDERGRPKWSNVVGFGNNTYHRPSALGIGVIQLNKHLLEKPFHADAPVAGPQANSLDSRPGRARAPAALGAIRAAISQGRRLLLIACGTGINGAIVDGNAIAWGMNEFGKLPMNVANAGDASYPVVLNRYDGLKRLAIRISEMLGFTAKSDVERISLAQFVTLLTDEGIAEALEKRGDDKTLWPAAAVAHVLGLADLAGKNDQELGDRLKALRPFIIVCLRRAGQFLVDAALTARLFQEFDAVMVAGHLSAAPAREHVWQGMTERAHSHRVHLEPLAPDSLCFRLSEESAEAAASLGAIRTSEEFGRELATLRKKFALAAQDGPAAEAAKSGAGRFEEDYLPPIVAWRLLRRVVGRHHLPVPSRDVSSELPVLDDWPTSPDWARIAANTVHALVAAAGLLGRRPVASATGWASPDQILQTVQKHAASEPLARVFVDSFANHGFSVLSEYKRTAEAIEADAAPLARLDFADALHARLAAATRPILVGVDIGRTKIRAGLYIWNSTSHSYQPLGKTKEFPTPSQVQVCGIVEAVVAKLGAWWPSLAVRGDAVVGVSWPGAVSSAGQISGFSGILGDAALPGEPPSKVTDTTPELLRKLDFRGTVRQNFSDFRTLTMNDLTAWQIGATAIASQAFPDEASLAGITPDHLAPLGAAIAAWLWGD